MSPPDVAVRITPADVRSPEAQGLVAELDEYLAGRYPPEERFGAIDREDVSDEKGTFLVAHDGERAVGCGAVRRIADATVEIKRMFVRPEARGLGVGRALLLALEAWSEGAGATRIVLETGVHQTEAIGLYEKCGYTRIPCFGAYAASASSICYGKGLGRPSVNDRRSTNRERMPPRP